MWEGFVPTLAAALIGFASAYWLMYTQIKENRKIAQAELLLQFDESLHHYYEIHWALRPDGKWKEGKPNEVSWAQVDAYVGLLERLYVLIENKIVEPNFANAFYGYRLENLLANREIRDRLFTAYPDDWQNFQKLCKALEIDTVNRERQ